MRTTCHFERKCNATIVIGKIARNVLQHLLQTYHMLFFCEDANIDPSFDHIFTRKWIICFIPKPISVKCATLKFSSKLTRIVLEYPAKYTILVNIVISRNIFAILRPSEIIVLRACFEALLVGIY